MEKLKYAFQNLNRLKIGLVLAGTFLVFFLISLFNLGTFPLSLGDFCFLFFLSLAFALYRPGWAFLFFVSTITLENLNLAPENFPLNLRAYQILALLVVSAICIRHFSKRLNFSLPRLGWPDFLIIIFGISGFISALNAPERGLSFKLSLIIISFILIYFITRIFVQDYSDLKRIIPFFFSSSFVIVLYGIWQSWRFGSGLESFEIMPGRPNSTFQEPDWLGIFLAFLISSLLAVVFYFSKKEVETYKEILGTKTRNLKQAGSWIFLTLSLTLLILTVSRSAWIGAMGAIAIFLFASLKINFESIKKWHWKIFWKNLFGIVVSTLISIAIIYIFSLTNFQLANRLESTGSGKQKITVSCEKETTIPQTISSIEELKKYNCRHINLEEIETEKNNGRFVSETYRPDPNFNIRNQIYQKSWEQIKAHPILGIGWGSMGQILGTDERGASLNASNLFLEIYLGSGLIGFLSLLIFWLFLLGKAICDFLNSVALSEKSWLLFIVSAWIALTFSNLFNSGIMLGFLWVFLAVSLVRK